MSQLAEERDGLHPPEGLLDQFPFALTGRVPDVSHRAPVKSTATGSPDVLRDMRSDVHRADRLDPAARVVQLVGTDRDTTARQRQVAEHHDGGIPLSCASRRRHRRIHNQAVAILGEQMTEIAEFGFTPDGFLKETRIGIRRRLVGVIAPPLAVKTHGRILRIVGRLPGVPLGLKLL